MIGLLLALVPLLAPATQEHPDVALVLWPGTRETLKADLATGTQRLELLRSSPAGRPTRADVLSGQHAQAHGIYYRQGDADLAPPGTLPRIFADAGYRTLLCGSWTEGRATAFGFEKRPLEAPVEAFREGVEAPRFLWWAPVNAEDEARARFGELRQAIGDDAVLVVLFDPPQQMTALPLDAAHSSSTETEAWWYGPGPKAGVGQPLDLAPTILAAAGLDVPEGMQGRDLTNSTARKQRAGVIWAPVATPRSQGGRRPAFDAAALHLREGRWKFVLYLTDVVRGSGRGEDVGHPRGSQNLFDLEADPEETRDLSGEPGQRARLDELRTAALAWWTESGGPQLREPWLLPALGPPPSGDRPNIVLVLSDDQDADHLGFLGNPHARTPALDKLAREGVVFPVAHVSASRCRPSLATLLSGMYPHRNRIHDNTSRGQLLRRDSLPNLLRAAGYATYKAGKFWEGSFEGMGFAGTSAFERFVREDGQSDLFTFLRANSKERPFFVWWAPMLPHSPFNPPARHRKPFEGLALEPPADLADPEAWLAAERTNYAMGAWLDEGFGALCDELRRLDEYDNTLFCFLIDNGWSNDRPSKGTVFEGGVTTPLVFTWGRGLDGGRRAEGLASTVDVYATLLDYAGVKAPADRPSRSLRAALEEDTVRGRDVLCGVGYRRRPRGNDVLKDAFVVYARNKRWKYTLYLRDVHNEDEYHFQTGQGDFPRRRRGDRDLFDLEADPDERVNLASDPDLAPVLEELHAAFLAWWSEHGDGELDLPVR